MPFPKEHSAQQASPDQFDWFRRAKPADFPPGVEVILGFRRAGGEDEEVQAIVFEASQWTPADAKAWLKSHGKAQSPFAEATGDRDDSVSVRLDDLGVEGVTQRVCRRFDVMPLRSPEQTQDGFVRAQGMITRSGVFRYTRRDGTVVRELRPPEEVFKPDSVASFTGMPLTLQHPPDLLTPKTVGEHAVGSVNNPVRAGDHIRADITILREDAINAVMKEGKNKLSCGYVCTVVDRGGTFVHADGHEEQFDAIQTGIGGNHVAICDNPRAGPSAHIRIDEADAFADYDEAFADHDEEKREDSTMEVEITINGKTYTVSKATAESMRADGLLESEPKDPPKKQKKIDGDPTSRALAETQEERDSLRGENAALKAKLDAKEKGDKETRAKLDAKQATKQRVELCAVASSILEKKLDEVLDMEDTEIMKAVIEKLEPEMKLDDENEAFIRGVFKTLTATRVDTAKEIQKLVNQGRQTGAEERKDADEHAKRADAAREDMLFEQRIAWMPESQKKMARERREKMLKA